LKPWTPFTSRTLSPTLISLQFSGTAITVVSKSDFQKMANGSGEERIEIKE
jgi:hypothetical protein